MLIDRREFALFIEPDSDGHDLTADDRG